jgi:hypothetical protein
MFFSGPRKPLTVVNIRGAKKPFPERPDCDAQNQRGKNCQNDCALDKSHFHLFSLLLPVVLSCGGAKIRSLETPPVTAFFLSLHRNLLYMCRHCAGWDLAHAQPIVQVCGVEENFALGRTEKRNEPGVNTFVKGCQTHVDVLGGLVDGEQLAADWPFILRTGFVSSHVPFLL